MRVLVKHHLHVGKGLWHCSEARVWAEERTGHGDPEDDGGRGPVQGIDTVLYRTMYCTVLYKLKIKWWKQKRGGGQCLKKTSTSATALDYDNVSGIFLVTFSGLGGSTVVSYI